MLRDTNAQTEPSSSSTPRFVVGTLLLFGLWLLLVGTLQAAEIFVGLAVAAFIAWLSRRQLRLLDDFRVTPLLPWHVSRYLAVFLYALLRANFDMARRVLSPRLPINPALVEVRTGLQSTLGRLILANSITLTPGTLTVDVRGGRLLVHWIDSAPGADLEHATQAIAAGFERHLRDFVK